MDWFLYDRDLRHERVESFLHQDVWQDPKYFSVHFVKPLLIKITIKNLSYVWKFIKMVN